MRKGNLVTARSLASRFLITQTELDRIRPDPASPAQQFIFSRLCGELPQRPLIIGGWRVSERYLIDYIRVHVLPILAQNALAIDELSIVDPEFNADGHTQLASFYRTNTNGAHLPASPHPTF